MRSLSWTSFALVLLTLVFGNPARADRDIVYAARYYLPPGSRGTSHFHLYTINADGTGRTQITFGNADDGDPHWSPDGRDVLFSRTHLLCLLQTANDRIRKVFDFGKDPEGAFLWQPCQWSPDGRRVSLVHTLSGKPGTTAVWVIDIEKDTVKRFPGASSISWSPDGRFAYLAYGNSHTLWDVRAGRNIRAPGVSRPFGPGEGALPLWIGDRTLIDWYKQGNQDDAPVFLRFQSPGGQKLRRVQLHYPTASGGRSGDALTDPGGLLPIPGHPRTLVYAAQDFNSTEGDVYEYLAVDLHTGRMRSLAYGPSISASQDGRRFCVAPPRDTVPYSRGRGGQERDVWVAPLEVGGISGGTSRNLTPGLVWVTEADWRHGRLPAARR